MLVNCIAYKDGSRLADLPVGEISDYLKRDDCFIWVALRDASEAELEQMKEEFGLHELAVEDARHGHQRPKIEEYGDSVFAVMHQLEQDGDAYNISEVNVFVGHNYVLSVRNHSQQHFLGVRERCEREPHLLQHGAGFVFYALMDAVVDRYFPIMDRLESELDEIEDQIFAKGAARANIERAGLADRVEVRVGVALEILPELAKEGRESFDLVFIDAEPIDQPQFVTEAVRLLRSGGAIVVLAPAHPRLYSPFDAAIGHERRYTSASLRAVASS